MAQGAGAMSDKHPPVIVLPATPPTFGPQPVIEYTSDLSEALRQERAHADRLADLLRVYRGPADSPIWNEIADFVAAVDAALAAHEERRARSARSTQ